MTLYKYVTHDRIDILANGVVRFSQRGVLNDPWEMRPFIERLIDEETFEKEIANKARVLDQKALAGLAAEKIWPKMPRRNRRAVSLIKLEGQILQLIQSRPDEFQRLYGRYLEEGLETFKYAAPLVISDIPNILNKRVGVLSLCEKPDHPLMWSHYAASHTGFVIAFDESHEFFTTRRHPADELSGLHEIVYSDERPHLESLFHPHMTWVPLFFTKDKQWEYEKEWRMVRLLDEATKVIENQQGDVYLFEFPAACISHIILGCQTSQTLERDLLALVKDDDRYAHVKMWRAVMDEQGFSLHIEPG